MLALGSFLKNRLKKSTRMKQQVILFMVHNPFYFEQEREVEEYRSADSERTVKNNLRKQGTQHSSTAQQ